MTEISEQLETVKKFIADLKGFITSGEFDKAIGCRDDFRLVLEQLKADILEKNMADTAYTDLLWEFQKIQNSVDYPEGIVSALKVKSKDMSLSFITEMETNLADVLKFFKAIK